MPNPEPELTLDEIGILEGTDKCSLMNDYLTAYEAALASYRNQPINLMEIGVLGGASLRVWRRYFTRARLVGIDIDRSCTRFAGERTEIRIGSQTDPEFLAKVAAEFPPTIVIDDGSHRTDDILFTFDRLFPVLAPGGCYVIEDLWLHAPGVAEHLRGTGPATPFEVLMPILQEVIEKRRPDAAAHIMNSYVSRSITRAACAPGIIILYKRGPSDELTAYIGKTVALLDRAGADGSWLHLLDYIVAHQGPLDLAEMAGRRAVVAAPQHAHAHVRLGVVRELQGDIRGALESVQRGVACAPNPATHADYSTYAERLVQRLSTA